MVLLVIGFLFAASACVAGQSGQDRIDRLCQGNCYMATLTTNAQFEPDQGATPQKNQWGLISTSQTIPAGLTVYVAVVMPDGLYPNTALVGWIDEGGHAQVGWVNVDLLGNWVASGSVGS